MTISLFALGRLEDAQLDRYLFFKFSDALNALLDGLELGQGLAEIGLQGLEGGRLCTALVELLLHLADLGDAPVHLVEVGGLICEDGDLAIECLDEGRLGAGALTCTARAVLDALVMHGEGEGEGLLATRAYEGTGACIVDGIQRGGLAAVASS